MENIKIQILDKIKSVKYFAVEESPNSDPGEFLELAEKFLTSDFFVYACHKAEKLMKLSYELRGKTNILTPAVNLMKMAGRSTNKPSHQYIHLANTFMLGLYLYHGCDGIKSMINKEMKSDKEISVEADGEKYNVTYSGGSEESEFLYRWRLCAFLKDIGYTISRANDDGKISDLVKEICAKYGLEINCVDDILKSGEVDLLEEIGRSLKIDLNKYYKQLIIEKGQYEKGLMAGILSYYIISKEYSKRPEGHVEKDKNGDLIIWSDHFLKGSILKSAAAVAFHNLDHPLYKTVYDKCIRADHDIKKASCFDRLLKIAGLLQVWDLPYDNDNMVPEISRETKLSFECHNDLVKVYNFPPDKSHEKEAVKTLAAGFFNIEFDCESDRKIKADKNELPIIKEAASKSGEGAGSKSQQERRGAGNTNTLVEIPALEVINDENDIVFSGNKDEICNVLSMPAKSVQVYSEGALSLFVCKKYNSFFVISNDYHTKQFYVDLNKFCELVRRRPLAFKARKKAKIVPGAELIYSGTSWSITCDYKKLQVIFDQYDYHAKILNLPFARVKEIIDKFKKAI